MKFNSTLSLKSIVLELPKTVERMEKPSIFFENDENLNKNASTVVVRTKICLHPEISWNLISSILNVFFFVFSHLRIHFKDRNVVLMNSNQS